MVQTRSPDTGDPSGAIVVMTVNTNGHVTELSVFQIFDQEPTSGFTTQDPGEIFEDNIPPDERCDGGSKSTVAGFLAEDIVNQVLQGHAATSHDDETASDEAGESTDSDTVSSLTKITQAINENDLPGSGSVVEVRSEPRHRQDLRWLVALWAMGLTTIVVLAAVVRWFLTPTLDVGPFLRSGIETPAIMGVAALVAWLFGRLGNSPKG